MGEGSCRVQVSRRYGHGERTQHNVRWKPSSGGFNSTDILSEGSWWVGLGWQSEDGRTSTGYRQGKQSCSYAMAECAQTLRE